MVCTPAHVCDARSARWRNRQGGVSENLIKNAALAAGALLRTDTRELHRGPGRLQPHTEAEYICADGHLVALITLVRRGLTIHNFQYLPLLAEDLVLAPEPPQLLALFSGQAVLAVAVVAIGLGDPVADRLRRRLELLRQLFRVPPGSHHLNEPPLELRRVRDMGLGHRELLFPRKGAGVHETGGTSLHGEGH